MPHARISLQRKTICIIGIPLLCVAFFVIYLLYQSARQQSLDNLFTTLSERTARQASELNLFFGQSSRHADSVATLITARGPSATMAHWALARESIESRNLDGMIIAYAQDPFKQSLPPSSHPYAISDEGALRLGYFNRKYLYDFSFHDWFLLPQLAGKGMWTDPLYSSLHHSMVVNYAAPFYAGSTFLGVVGVALSAEKIRQQVEDINIQGSKLILVSQFGTIVAHPNKDYTLRHTLVSLANDLKVKDLQDFAYSLRKGQKVGVQRFAQGFLGPNEYVAYAPVPHTGWMLLSIIPEATVLRPLQYTVIQSIFWVLVGGFILFGVIYLLESAAVVRPLQRLEEASRQVARGKFNALVPETSNTREIRNLEAAFNSMVSQWEISLRNEIEAGRAKSYAEEASRAKSDFLARMSHEIRTPMNAILGLTYLALRDDPQGPQRAHLEKIQRAGKGMLSILNDILDFSKIEAGKLELNETPFRLHDLAQDMRDMFEAVAREKGLRFQVHVDADLPEYLKGDSLRIAQILLNLCNNAVKFTTQGSITIAIQRDPEASANTDLCPVRISVQDTGIGIPPPAQAELFSKFMQADSSTTRRYGGTGLGLAICRLLAELMRGEIFLASSSPQGTTFVLRLPLTEALEPAEGIVAPASKDVGSTSWPAAYILVAEDNEINQEIIASLLDVTPARYRMVNDGIEALNALSEEHFDLVLMDMQMPNMDGITATMQIRHRGYILPVLALTANALQSDRERCLAAGMNGHIAKPVDPPFFYAELGRWLSKSDAL